MKYHSPTRHRIGTIYLLSEGKGLEKTVRAIRETGMDSGGSMREIANTRVELLLEHLR